MNIFWRLSCFFLGYFFFAPSLPGLHAQEMPPRFVSLYHDLTNLKLGGFPQRLSALAEQEDAKPQDLAYVAHLASSHDFLLALLQEDRGAIERALALKNARLAALDALAEPERAYLKAELSLQMAFLLDQSGKELDALWNVKKAYGLIKETVRNYPDFYPAQKSHGVLLVAFGSLPANYRWISAQLGLEGDVGLGMAKLNQSQKTSLRRHQGLYHLDISLWQSLVNFFLVKDESQAIASLEELSQVRPDSRLVEFVRAMVYLKCRKAQEAEQLLARLDGKGDYLSSPFAHYFRGLCALYAGEHGRAKVCFLRFINQHQGASYIKDANYRLALINALQGNTEASTYYFEQTQAKGSTRNSVDAYAHKSAQLGLPHLGILQLRYAADGGYYHRAHQLADNIDRATLNPAEHLELDYRMARLAHAENNTKQAQKAYRALVEQGYQEGNYFQPKAALLLGSYLLEHGKEQEAEHYLAKAIAYENHPYEADIESQAFALLKSINKGK